MTTISTIPHVALSHFGMYVNNLGLMEDFYTRVLGYLVTDRGNHAAPNGPQLLFMSRDGNEHHQIVMATGRPAALSFNVINQLSFRVADLAALRYFHGALSHEEAVTELSPVTHGNAISLYFKDPEGNRLELFTDTPWYAPQPLREPVDWSKSDEEILAWTEQMVRAMEGYELRSEWSARLNERLGLGREGSPR